MLLADPRKVLKHVIDGATFHCKVMTNRKAIGMQESLKGKDELKNYLKMCEVLSDHIENIDGLVDQDGEDVEVPKVDGKIELTFWDLFSFSEVLTELFGVVTRTSGLTADEVKN